MKKTRNKIKKLISALAGMVVLQGSILHVSAAPNENDARSTIKTAVVTADVLNVRESQGTQWTILTQILEGESYEIIGEPVDGWYPLQVYNIEGWVCGDYIKIESSDRGETGDDKNCLQDGPQTEASAQIGTAAGRDVIEYACQFIGNPYVWGGTSLTNGADCSGFVQSVYRHFGITLPRTTYEMVHSGYAVSYADAQPGDLILYDGHVGLYMGDGTIVNAMNEQDGIGICSATYTDIIAVRRVL